MSGKPYLEYRRKALEIVQASRETNVEIAPLADFSARGCADFLSVARDSDETLKLTVNGPFNPQTDVGFIDEGLYVRVRFA